MLSRLKNLLSRTDAAPAFDAPLEIGRPTYAIGDIHGRDDLLDTLLGMILADANDAGIPNPRFVFLGDYVDRGEQSREVLERLVKFRAKLGEDAVFLRGNHEEMLLEFLDAPQEGGPRWLRNGGLQTLMSFGVGGVSLGSQGEDLDRARDRLAAELGELADFLRSLSYSLRDENVFFSHAGADPSLPVEMQRETNLVWGARGFLSTPRADGVWVAHGHFVEDEPFARAGRISVDTGACFTGRLSAARIADGAVAFLTT